ncbi:hypothetical protein [Streptomyces sp. NPDC057403]|uniref:hypothetical protein n=1 Tax=Streptomyces sp. NPDC057403 TaxID=3346119 RepID=UPI0036A0EC02
MKPTAQRRRERRALLDNLLARMLRGVLSAAEAALLAECVREEQRVYDQTRRSLGETGQAVGEARETLRKHREAADAAIREFEQRAVDAEEQLTAYRAVEESRQAWARRVAADMDTALARAERAEAALDRVRDAQRLGEALAAVAEFDGLTPEAARTTAAFAVAADSTEARLAEQQREHEITLATLRKNLSESEALGHRLLQRAERAEYDAGRAERRLDRLTRAYTEQTEALRREAQRADEQGREGWEQAAQQRSRANGYREAAEEADHKAARYRLAWMAARRDRKADRAAMAAEAPLVQTGRVALTLAGLNTAEAVASVRQWAAAGIPAQQIGRHR